LSDYLEGDPIEIPINGTLDLHGFQPSEVKDLVLEYIEECHRRSIFEGRIIHGKGMGTLREIVHSILSKSSKVISFSLGVTNSGGWGSTSFILHNSLNKE
tara:strand:+ start:879 stop:1178 length:300 start_codon:yes stop_codon:yes gene_type:complete